MIALICIFFTSGAVTAYGAYSGLGSKSGCSLVPFDIYVALGLSLMLGLLIFSYNKLRNTLKNKLQKQFERHKNRQKAFFIGLVVSLCLGFMMIIIDYTAP
jgi:hypothetical protein